LLDQVVKHIVNWPAALARDALDALGHLGIDVFEQKVGHAGMDCISGRASFYTFVHLRG